MGDQDNNKKSEAALDELTDKLYSFSKEPENPSKEYLELMKIADEMEDQCCQLRSNNILIPGCAQLNPSAAQEQAKAVAKMLQTKLTFLQNWWDSSSAPAYDVMYRIAGGDPVSFQQKQQALADLDTNFSGMVDRCLFIDILNGWNRG